MRVEVDARTRDALCVDEYNRSMAQRGVAKKADAVIYSTRARAVWRPMQPLLPSASGRLAVLVRGQTYRGNARASFAINAASSASRNEAQLRCIRSLVELVVEPYEVTGHGVGIFLTLYEALGGTFSGLLSTFGSRVLSINVIQANSTQTQLATIACALQDFISWCTAHPMVHFDAVVITRFDLYLKANLFPLLGPARAVDGIRLLWREVGGHWRNHASPRTVNGTFRIFPRRSGGIMQNGRLRPSLHEDDWRRKTKRAPDALIGFTASLTRCFYAAVRSEMFPSLRMQAPLNFLHHIVIKMRTVLPPATLQYMVDGAFDSNPCRSACMLNPIYDLLPRMRWITDSGVCQRASQFAYDERSQSSCCASPNYCCPNSVTSCDHPNAVRFDVFDAGVPPHMLLHWPAVQDPPLHWEMTERSFVHIANIYLHEATRHVQQRYAINVQGDAGHQGIQPSRQAIYRGAARKSLRESRYWFDRAVNLMHDALPRRRVSPAVYREFARGWHLPENSSIFESLQWKATTPLAWTKAFDAFAQVALRNLSGP